MKLLMHVLKKNNKLKIDNENIGPVDNSDMYLNFMEM